MSSSDDSWDNSADSNSEWDLTSDDSNSSDVADGEEAEFNDIDGLLPEGREVGTYVELDGAESDHDREHLSFIMSLVHSSHSMQAIFTAIIPILIQALTDIIYAVSEAILWSF